MQDFSDWAKVKPSEQIYQVPLRQITNNCDGHVRNLFKLGKKSVNRYVRISSRRGAGLPVWVEVIPKAGTGCYG